MSNPTPSPPPIASGSKAGILSAAEQAIQGVKSFVHGLAVAAGVRVWFNGKDGDAHASYDATSGRVVVSRPLQVTPPPGQPLGVALQIPAGAAADFGDGKTIRYNSAIDAFEVLSSICLRTNARFIFSETSAAYLYWDTQRIQVMGGLFVNNNLDVYGDSLKVTSGPFFFVTRNRNPLDPRAFRFRTEVLFPQAGDRLFALENGFPENGGEEVFSIGPRGKFHRLRGDSTFFPGDATVNDRAIGRSCIEAGADFVRITSNQVTIASGVRAWIQQDAPDLTLTHIINTKVGPGYFEIVGNAPATDHVTFWWEVIN